MLREPGLTSRDTLVAITTLSFDIAGLEIYLPLIAGAQLIIAPERAQTDGTALARVFIQGAIHRAVNSESTTAPNNEHTITESLVRTENPTYSECELHTGGESNPHVSCRFAFDICDSRCVASAETRGDLRCRDSH